MRKISHPNDLFKKVHKVLVIDLLQYVSDITDMNILELLVEPTDGLYVKGGIKPILYKDKEYYYRPSKEVNELVLIEDLSIVPKLTTDILDKDMKVVLPVLSLLNKSRYLTLEPTLPITAMEFGRYMALDYLGKICPYSRYIKKGGIEDFIKPEYYDSIDEYSFEDAYQHMLDDIHDFIDDCTWNIYFTKNRMSTLIIEQSIDWRIYDWHRIQYDKHSNELDNDDFDIVNRTILEDISKRR